MEYFLIDNGSLRAGSILQMRQIALSLSQVSGYEIHPFGLMHSHKVDSGELENKAADSMQNFLLSKERTKSRRFGHSFFSRTQPRYYRLAS